MKMVAFKQHPSCSSVYKRKEEDENRKRQVQFYGKYRAVEIRFICFYAVLCKSYATAFRKYSPSLADSVLDKRKQDLIYSLQNKLKISVRCCINKDGHRPYTPGTQNKFGPILEARFKQDFSDSPSLHM